MAELTLDNLQAKIISLEQQQRGSQDQAFACEGAIQVLRQLMKELTAPPVEDKKE